MKTRPDALRVVPST